MTSIVILEPDAAARSELERALGAASPGVNVEFVADAAELRTALKSAPESSVVFVERDSSDGSPAGLEIVKELRRTHPRMPIVLLAKSGSVEGARAAIAAGASDFLVRGESLLERVKTLLEKLAAVIALLDENRELRRSTESPIVGRSDKIRKLVELVGRVARVPRPVLIQGERGTGKELVARAIHAASGRPGSLVTVNCAALSEQLLEAELFGYEKGAFTGADRQAKGKFEIAANGNLFLDEIGHMPLGFQQKILRVVEYGAFLRVGGNRELRVDTRVVAATNVDLRERIQRGSFLPDLYDRLAFEVIVVPPLRDRPEDIAPLAEHFLQRFMHEVPEFAGKRLSPAAIDLLEQYAFPGNVRELKNIIERAVYRDTTQELTPEDIDLPITPRPEIEQGSFKLRIELLEKELIRDALERASGNQAQAARLLGLSYHQFRYFYAKHAGKAGAS